MRFVSRCAPALLFAVFAPALLQSQGTLADYQRAQEVAVKTRHMVVNNPGPATWIGNSGHFWYHRSVPGGTEFLLVDAASASKKPAFDHDKLATGISTATGKHYTGLTLPFAPSPAGRGGAGGGRGGFGSNPGELTFLNNESSVRLGSAGSRR